MGGYPIPTGGTTADIGEAAMEWVDMGHSVLTPEAVRYITGLHERIRELDEINTELRRAEGVYESLWIAACKALEAVEWKGNGNPPGSIYCVCPECRQYRTSGHAPDCLIALALPEEKSE